MKSFRSPCCIQIPSRPVSCTRTVARKSSIGGFTFARGLYICVGGAWYSNLTKIPLIYIVSYFNLGGLGALFGGLSPPEPPVATGLSCTGGCMQLIADLLRRLLFTVVQLRRTLLLHHSYTMLPMKATVQSRERRPPWTCAVYSKV